MRAQRRMYWFAQLLGWFSYSMVIFLVLYVENKLTWNGISLLVLFSIVGIVVSHLMRWFITRFNFFQFKPGPLIPRLLLVAFAGAIIFQLVYSLFATFFNRSSVPDTVLEMIIEIVLIMFLFMIWTIIYFSYHFNRKSRLEELKNLQLSDSQKEIELQNLRTQLNPHFLFNALNSIRALIDLEPKLAKESVTKLSNILRNSLLFGRKESVTIEEECEFVRDYLDLEKVRFEERLQVEWNIEESVLKEFIPPLIIQTLVENSIKHGISNLKKGGLVRISACLKDKKLILNVFNTGEIQTRVDTGVGIQNTRRRLALMYGDNANFELEQQSEGVMAQITIKR